MTRAGGQVGWGATIDSAPVAPHGVRTWEVRIESEPLGSLALDSALARFADDAARLAPDAAPRCSLSLGRLALTLAVDAGGPEEAADRGEDVFGRALESALWPRKAFACLVEYSVAVAPTGADRRAA